MNKRDQDRKYLNEQITLLNSEREQVLAEMRDHGANAVLPRLNRSVMKLLVPQRMDVDATLFDLKHRLDLDIANYEHALAMDIQRRGI